MFKQLLNVGRNQNVEHLLKTLEFQVKSTRANAHIVYTDSIINDSQHEILKYGPSIMCIIIKIEVLGVISKSFYEYIFRNMTI